MNPIFIYSATGYGKTHLLNAIGNAYQERYPGRKVLYTNTDQFIDEFVKYATGNSDADSFKQYFKSIDILLIDDIQFLKGKNATSAFFFNIFNSMISEKKQIVITSDSSPAELDCLEDRLVSRFSGGLSIMIKKPQPDTMMDILKLKIVSLGLKLEMFDDSSLQYLVDHNPANIRSMEGDLKKILFLSTTHQNTGKIDLNFRSVTEKVEVAVKKILSVLEKSSMPYVTTTMSLKIKSNPKLEPYKSQWLDRYPCICAVLY